MTPLHGLCIITDQYFLDFPNIHHMSNKHESRPYYLAVKQEGAIWWVVPLSSRVEKYQEKIKSDEKKHGECIFYHVAKVKGREKAFLIGNVIPVTAQYIKRPFTVSGVPFVIQDKNTIRAIQTKLKRYLAMVRYNKLQPFVDIMQIEKILKEAN